MPVIKQRVPWTKQPQINPTIDWGNPLAKKLIFAAVGGKLVNVVNKTAGGLIGGAAIGVTDLGLAFQGTGTTQRVDFTNSIVVTPTEYSYGSVFKYGGTNVSGNQYLINALADGANFHVLTLLPASPNITLIWGAATSARTAAFTPSVGANYVVSASTPPSGITDVNAARIYIDGVNTANSGGAGGTFVSTTNKTIILGGRSTDNNRNFNGSQMLSVIWARSLSDAEHAAFNRNPWQIFAP